MTGIDRRAFLEATLAAAACSVTRVAFASTGTDARFVLVLLRGALDGLAAVPPTGDPAYARLRGEIALAPAGQLDGALPLDGLFGLHPAFAFLHERYAAGELAVVHAVATAYRERSHFDAQDLLENGHDRPHAGTDGWLNRALAALPGGVRPAGVALGANVPLVMRGGAAVTSWSPADLDAPDDDTLARIADLYAADALLSRRLAEALASDAIADATQSPAAGDRQMLSSGRRRQDLARFAGTARVAAGFLARPDGPRVATIETTGWDTHANQGGAKGQLALRLVALDAGLRALHDGLGTAWKHTVVALVTEFGRTAAVNGTRGTDHGTGAAVLLLGGAVAGGRVIGEWPGLDHGALLQGRDLRPTSDLRAVLKGVLNEHLAVPMSALEMRVFPGSGPVRPLAGLVRGA